MKDKLATIIYNPMSGRRGRRAQAAHRMIELLKARGVQAGAVATAGPDDATQLAREAASRGAQIIVSFGGDGTLNEILQGIAGTNAILAVWPGGTANVVATDLGISRRPEQIADMIAAGKTRRVALGVASREAQADAGAFVRISESLPVADELEFSASQLPAVTTSSPVSTQRFFLMMAGIGLDASIARGVNKKLKRRTGEFAYWVTGIKHLLRWQAEPFVIEVDGEPYESVFTVIGNGKGYGGRMCMTPGAKLEEPWFEVYMLPRLASNFSYLGALSGCLRGKPERTRARIVRGRHIKAHSTGQPWVEVDGEVIGPLPMTFDVVPDALSLIVP